MANRYPLIIDATNKKLKELPIGDNLRVDGDIVISNGNITINGNPLNETIFINYNQINNPPIIPADIDELADINNILSTRDLVGASIFSADSTLLIDGINGTISYDILVDTPFIPNDISQLSDVQGLLGDGSTIAGIGTFQLPKMTTAQRNNLTPEEGDMIYNFDVPTVQVYVGVSAWTSDPDNPETIPGWVNLFTPPPNPFVPD